MGLLEHAAVAVAVQALIGLSTGRWWAGAGIACAYFVGREFAQAEYRWIEQFAHGKRANMPYWAVFDARVWQTTDQLADVALPVVATFAVAWWFDKQQSRKIQTKRPQDTECASLLDQDV